MRKISPPQTRLLLIPRSNVWVDTLEHFCQRNRARQHEERKEELRDSSSQPKGSICGPGVLPALKERLICSSLGPQTLEPAQTPSQQWLHYNANCIPKVCVCC